MEAIRVIGKEIKAMPFGVKVIASLAVAGSFVAAFNPPKTATVRIEDPVKTEVVQATPDHYINEANRKLAAYSRTAESLRLEFAEYSAKHEYRKALGAVDRLILETETILEDSDVAIAITQDKSINDRIYDIKIKLIELETLRASGIF